MSQETFTPTESTPESTFDPSEGNPFMDRASAVSRERFVNVTPPPEDVTPGISAVGNFVRKHPGIAVGAALVAGAAGDAIVGDPIGSAIENGLSADQLVSVGTVYDDGDGFLDSALEKANEMVLEANIADPAKVDFESLRHIATTQPIDSTNFTIELIDQGRNYTFERAAIAENASSITLNPNATFHKSPQADSTSLMQASEAGTVIGENRILTFESPDGTWYGVSPSWIADGIHDQMSEDESASLLTDTDEKVWVHESDIQSIQPIDGTSIE